MWKVVFRLFAGVFSPIHIDDYMLCVAEREGTAEEENSSVTSEVTEWNCMSGLFRFRFFFSP